MVLSRATTTLAVALSCCGVAEAADVFAVAAATKELYKVDSMTGQTTLVGPYKTSNSDFGIFSFAAANDGTLLGITSSNQPVAVWSFDEQTGQTTLVKKLPNPVITAGAAVDPTDGSLWFLNTFGFVSWPFLNRLDLGTGAITVPGLIGPNGSDHYSGIAFDAAGQLYALNGTTNSLWIVDKSDPAGPNTLQVGAGIGGGIDLSQGSSLSFDPVGQTMLGYEAANGRLVSVDVTTGLGTVLHAGLQPDFAGIAVDAGGCAGSIVPFGAGCAGSGGIVPQLTMSGCPVPGDQIGLSITQGLGGSTALLFFGLNQAATPIGGGCTLNVTPLLPLVLSLSLGGNGPGTGTTSISGLLPANAGGASFTTQAFVIDPANPIGAAGTNGVEVTIP